MEDKSKKFEMLILCRQLVTIRVSNKITISEMANYANVSERTIQRYLKEFQDAGILKREGSDSGGRWVLDHRS